MKLDASGTCIACHRTRDQQIECTDEKCMRQVDQREAAAATVAVPRRFLEEFMKALDFHGGHGTPSFDRVQAVVLHEEARLLLTKAPRG